MPMKESALGLFVMVALFFGLLFGGSKLPAEIGAWRTAILGALLLGIVLWFVVHAARKLLAIRSSLALERKLKAQAEEQIVDAIGRSVPGIDAAADVPIRAEKKSYFIHDLFTKAVFPDRGLVRPSNRIRSARRLAGLATVGLLIAGFLGISAALVASFFATRSRLHRGAEAGQAVRRPDADVAELDRLRAEIVPLEAGAPFWRRLGFNRDAAVLEPAPRLCLERLRRTRLVRLDGEIRARPTTGPEFDDLADLLPTYRILTGEVRPEGDDLELVRRVLLRHGWFEGDVEERRLDFYLARFAAAPRIGPVDARLVDRIVRHLRGSAWIVEIYREILRQARESGCRDCPGVDASILKSASGREYLTFGSAVHVPRGRSAVGGRSGEASGEAQSSSLHFFRTVPPPKCNWRREQKEAAMIFEPGIGVNEACERTSLGHAGGGLLAALFVVGLVVLSALARL